MLYDYPQYYEIAFSFRDIEAEASFLDSCIKQFSRTNGKNVFEVGCGPAPHAGALARLGYQYCGLDINRNMLDHATYKWHDLKPSPRFVDGDMVSFDLPQTADFAFVMLGSLYLNSLEEMTSHFNSMARALKPGGLYFLDWCVQFTDPMAREMSNVVVNEAEGITIESHFSVKLIDSAKQMYEEIWTINIDDHGRHKNFEMVERNKAIFPQEFLLFIESRTDFEFVGWWHDWDLTKPIDGSSQITRPVVLIRRK
jgi:SAM-dependent methyltransferase